MKLEENNNSLSIFHSINLPSSHNQPSPPSSSLNPPSSTTKSVRQKRDQKKLNDMIRKEKLDLEKSKMKNLEYVGALSQILKNHYS